MTCAVVLCAAVPASYADRTYGASFDMVGEFSTMDGSLLIGPAESDESFDYNPSPLAGRLWVSFPMWKGRLAPGMAFRLPYAAGGGEDSEEFMFGYLIEPSVAYEYSIGWKKDVDIPITGRVGMPILFPSGDFSRMVDMLEPVGAVSAPRLGWLLGTSGGVRKQLNDKWAIRGDLILEWSRLYLLATRAKINDTPYSKDWQSKTFRLSLSVGLELTL